MDVTMVGLQNAGKSSLLRVLAVCIDTQDMDAWLIYNAGSRVHSRVSGLDFMGFE